MRIVICDDEILDIDYICPIIENFFTFYNVPVFIKVCKTGRELLNYADDVQVLIMDIQLKNENGMEVVKQFHNTHLNTKVIYYSSNIDCAYQTYAAYGFGFIKKPISIENLYSELNRVLNELQLNQIMIPEIHGVNFSINKNKIIYIRANRRYSTIITENNTIESNRSISEWEKILALDEAFQLCRRGRLINLYAVDRIDMYGIIHLSNGDHINLSEKIGQKFKEEYAKFWGNHLC